MDLSSSKSRKFRIFGKNLPLKDKSPSETCTKLGAGEGVPGPYPHAKVHGCGFKDVGLQALISPKLVYLPPRVYPLNRFLHNLARRTESKARTFMPNFTDATFKMCAYSPQYRQNWYFLYKFARKGYIPLSDFYQIWLGELSPRSAPSRQISPLWPKNVGLLPPKSRKM